MVYFFYRVLFWVSGAFYISVEEAGMFTSLFVLFSFAMAVEASCHVLICLPAILYFISFCTVIYVLIQLYSSVYLFIFVFVCCVTANGEGCFI